MCIVPLYSSNSCTKINKQQIHSISRTVIIPWLQWCCTILTSSVLPYKAGINTLEFYVPPIWIHVLIDLQEKETWSSASRPVCKSRRIHPAQLSKHRWIQWARLGSHRHSPAQNCSADTSSLECTTHSIPRLLPSNTSLPMPPGQQLTQPRTTLRPGRGQEQFQFSSWIGQHSQVLWLSSFFKTPQPLGISLCWNKIITDFKERVTSFCCRERKTGTSEKVAPSQ